MKKENIEIGQKYYYNNRPVIVLEKVDTTDFIKVLLNSKVNLDGITGENFCSLCMSGGGYSHECHNAQDVLDIVKDECKTQEICYVLSNELNENYFEYVANDKLKQENDSLKTLNEELKSKQKLLQKAIDKLCLDKDLLHKNVDNLKDKCKEKQDEVIEIQNKIRDAEKQLAEREVILAADGILKISIPSSELHLWFDSYLKLEALQAGGVDNWDWYYESLKQFYDKEAARQFILSFWK